MTNITTNLSSHFFGFLHGDLKIIVAKVQEKKLKERQILQREVIFTNVQYPFRFIVNDLWGAFNIKVLHEFIGEMVKISNELIVIEKKNIASSLQKSSSLASVGKNEVM